MRGFKIDPSISPENAFTESGKYLSVVASWAPLSYARYGGIITKQEITCRPAAQKTKKAAVCSSRPRCRPEKMQRGENGATGAGNSVKYSSFLEYESRAPLKLPGRQRTIADQEVFVDEVSVAAILGHVVESVIAFKEELDVFALPDRNHFGQAKV
jgi:hypothetical protein